MGSKAVKARREAAEIRKVLWRALIAFTIGILIAMLAFSYWGDKFLHDICPPALGRIPAYLLLGTFVGGMYMVIQFVGEKVYKGTAPNMHVSFTTVYAVMIVLAPLAFVWLIIVRLRQLSKLREIEMEEENNS
jgi:MFS family permease